MLRTAPELGLNPNRKVQPDLQLCSSPLLVVFSRLRDTKLLKKLCTVHDPGQSIMPWMPEQITSKSLTSSLQSKYFVHCFSGPPLNSARTLTPYIQSTS